MKTTRPKAKLTFAHTRRAVAKIKEPSIRNDFAEMVDGIEFCFAKRKKRAALSCANIVLGMAVGLNRTISPRVAAGILDGLLKDGKQDALFRRMDLDEHKDQKCDVDSSQCVPKKGAKCFNYGGIPGCGGGSGFSFLWSRSLANRS